MRRRDGIAIARSGEKRNSLAIQFSASPSTSNSQTTASGVAELDGRERVTSSKVCRRRGLALSVQKTEGLKLLGESVGGR